ncbi:hypothetical protein [Streptomyces vinaceus]|uniref:hypothetical protein n=1 Tax=Streptomyces vinaceus TaxID=1960 RepID=UPI001672BC1E|nr:hypothetical protein [Streptomyces vinaceus]GHE25378.1 hypothetical protein GCM10017778_02250 [Streptomyces vinaceus]
MTAWQYLAGAGMVAALCPLYGHVAVADDGTGPEPLRGHGARLDVCVRGGQPKPPAVLPPVRIPVPGAERPTVHHPGRGPAPAARAAGTAPPPTAKAAAGRAEPAPAAPEPAAVAEPAPAATPAPPRAAAVAAPVSSFHVRPYHSIALERRTPGGMSTVMLMVVVTTPAVLAAAALRPRSRSGRS